MKKLFYAVTFMLSLAFASTAQAGGLLPSIKATHIDSSVAYPRGANARIATYKFELHVQGNPVTELSLDIPEDVNVGSFEVQDRAGGKVDASVSVVAKNAVITFAQPISPETILEIRMKDVSTRWGRPNTWLFPLSAKNGSTASIPVGLVQIQIRSR